MDICCILLVVLYEATRDIIPVAWNCVSYTNSIVKMVTNIDQRVQTTQHYKNCVHCILLQVSAAFYGHHQLVLQAHEEEVFSRERLTLYKQ